MTDMWTVHTLDDGKLTVLRDYVWLLHRHGLDSFESYYDESMGELLRDVGVRSNVRVEIDRDGVSKTFFLKRHEPLRLRDRLASWLRLRRPRTPARVEWENVELLRSLGISSMEPVVMGEDPVTGRSFLMTVAIESALPADDYAKEHFSGTDAVLRRRRFVRRLGELVRRLHWAGLTHRDLYLCHVFVRETDGDVELRLIDLQRVGRHVFERRWQVKDLAQLAYSRPGRVFTATDAVRFLHVYFNTPRLGWAHRQFARDVLRKVARMKQRKVAGEKRG